MAKKNNSLLDEIFESDWKFSAFVAVIAFLFAFVLLPIVISGTMAKILLPMVQTLTKWFIYFCVLVSISKLFLKIFRNNKKPEPLDFEKVEPTISSSTSRSPFEPKKPNPRSNQIKQDDELKPDWLVDDPPVEFAEKQFNVKEQWTLDFINSLDWNLFESLCSRYFTAAGIKNSETGLGADDGIDLILYEESSQNPIGLAQCKKWSNPIGVALLREFLGVMHSKKVLKGYFFTTSKFNQTAIKFADENNIQLIDGALLVSLLKGLDHQKQQEIYDAITQGDYTTPTCVRCGKKMILRTNKKTHQDFWGCNTYRCMSTLNIKSKQKN